MKKISSRKSDLKIYQTFRKARSLSLIVLMGLSIFSCGDDDGINSSVEINLDPNSILNIVNNHRRSGANCGGDNLPNTGGLQWSDELAKAALDHSNDMQQNGYFDHTSQDGRKFSERAKSAGFEGSPVGENIASGYQSEESVMQGWMESSGHCKNIMNSNATHVGVARSNEGALWTMVLGRQ
ncbi:CAP domain-containing protein [Ekhidna sp.]